jgi:DNA end-binding protein Ku
LARSIASLTISFGLVSIPVKMYAATQSARGIHFNFLHERCGSRLRQQYVCIKEEVVVPREEMVKGYEFTSDQYVTFTKEELKELEEAGTGAAEITEFLPVEAIDPVYFEKAYYLGPDKGGAKPYALLREALEQSGRSALGRYAARGKQYLVLIRALADGLAMQQLLYSDEVRTIKELDVPQTPVTKAELALAIQLIEQLTAKEFQPDKYRDEVKERIEAAIQRKVEGQEVTVAEEPQSDRAQVIDLMAALRASVQRADAVAAGPSADAARPARKPARRAAEPAAGKARTTKATKAARK